MRDGFVRALIAQDPYHMGYLGVQQAVLAIGGGATTPTITTELAVLTATTIDDPAMERFLYHAECP